MIGKSFFYQKEYLKAERKFEELLAQYPNSSLVLEVQLWYARTEEKLGKLEEGIRLSEATISAAQSSGDRKIEIQTRQLLAVLYFRMKKNDKAVSEYEKVIALTSDNEIRRDAQINLGDIYFSNTQYEKALEAYLRAKGYTSDIYSNYYCGLKAAISYREMGEKKKGLTLLNAMIEDFRNKDFLPILLFERANNYHASERRDEAIAEYIKIDTTYARTEYAIQSAYQLGVIYEKEFGDYQLALKYYSEVNSFASADSMMDGRLKFLAITRYFDAWRTLIAADSLLVILKDTTYKMEVDTAGRIVSDTIKNKTAVPISQSTPLGDDVTRRASSQRQGSKPISDSVQSKNAKVVRLPQNIDSLAVIKSIAAQELGDVFYSEILIPDSAFYWYNQSLEMNYNHVRSPRVLYILGQLSRTYPEKKFSATDEYYKRLDRDFPESIYAEEVRLLLGKSTTTIKADTATEYYKEAERQIDAKQYSKAIEKLHTIKQLFPSSPLAAKSEYAIGWIYENHLEQPESATVHYKSVMEHHAGTKYAFAASRRSIDTMKVDTTKKVAGINSKKIDSTKTIDNVMNPKMINAKDVKKDTVETNKKMINRESMDLREEMKKMQRQKPDTIKTKPNILEK
jgi:tetratricopeptide (TPR) repeat protein